MEQLIKSGVVTNDNIDDVKAAKIAEMSVACNEVITQGFDITLSDKKSHHFSLEVADQLKISKLNFSLGLRAADGQETAFYTYDPDSGPAEMRLFAALPEGAAGKTLVLRCAEPSALSAMLGSESVLATQTKLSSYYFRRSLYALVFFLLCLTKKKICFQQK